MQKTRSIYQSRLERFTDTLLFGDHNLHSVLYKKQVKLTSDNIQIYHAPGMEKPLFTRVMSEDVFAEYAIDENEVFGPTWSTHWFRIVVDEDDFEEGMYLDWRAGCEGLLYTESGVMIAAVSDARNEVKLPKAGTYYMVPFLVICQFTVGNGVQWIDG